VGNEMGDAQPIVPARRRPTLRTVAAAAGVSTMTVSNAYNRPEQVSPATRDRILATAAEQGYAGPDPAARSLRRGRCGTVGVLLTERLPYAFNDPGQIALLHGLASGLAEAGQALLLIPRQDDPTHELLRNALVDALVLAGIAPDDPALAVARARRIPLVSVGGRRLARIPHVGIDELGAAADAAQHLLGLGHRRFGVVAVPSGSDTGGQAPARLGLHDRVGGFLSALAAAGIDPTAVPVTVAGDITRQAGRTAGAELLDRPARTRPTAVFAVIDVLALGVLDAAEERGLAIPAALSVVGFDDIAEAARNSPALTTMAQPLFDKGRAAGRIALAAVAGRTARPPRLTTRLVVRGTTAPPARP
jgi:DNA-binding LacI/PurR family transcriptional regulator